MKRSAGPPGPRRLLIGAALLVALLLGLWRQRAQPAADGETADRGAPESLQVRPPAAAPAAAATAVKDPAPHAAASAALLPARQEDELKQPAPSLETPIPGFKPEPGADDPGPGPFIDRYDGRSGRLSPHATPGGGEVTTRVSSTGPAPVLTVWVPSIRVQAGAEVVIRALLQDENGARVQGALVALIAPHGEAPGEPALPLGEGAEGGYELRFRAAAKPAGSLASASAKPSGALAPAAFDYVVQARGTSALGAFERVAVGTFLVHASGGQLDSAWARLEKRGADLTLAVPARLEAPGTYWMYAELWGGPKGDQPIAFARDRFERLSPGARTLVITFGGAVIRESAIDGPYVVRNLRFQQVDAFPPQESEPVAQLPPSAAFRAADFN